MTPLFDFKPKVYYHNRKIVHYHFDYFYFKESKDLHYKRDKFHQLVQQEVFLHLD
jgi:hypothetical protein